MISISASSVVGTVTKVIRHGHTIYGNPMMSVVLKVTHIEGTPVAKANDDGTLTNSELEAMVRLQNNSGLAYGIENREYRDEPHEYTLTKAGRINGVKRVERGA